MLFVYFNIMYKTISTFIFILLFITSTNTFSNNLTQRKIALSDFLSMDFNIKYQKKPIKIDTTMFVDNLYTIPNQFYDKALELKMPNDYIKRIKLPKGHYCEANISVNKHISPLTKKYIPQKLDVQLYIVVYRDVIVENKLYKIVGIKTENIIKKCKIKFFELFQIENNNTLYFEILMEVEKKQKNLLHVDDSHRKKINNLIRYFNTPKIKNINLDIYKSESLQ
jgi:hypothetical protein